MKRIQVRHYIPSIGFHFQFGTKEADIESSKVLVAEWDGFSDFLPTKFRRMQITPDCCIFISLPNYNLGAIGDVGGYPCDSTKITISSSKYSSFYKIFGKNGVCGREGVC